MSFKLTKPKVSSPSPSSSPSRGVVDPSSFLDSHSHSQGQGHLSGSPGGGSGTTSNPHHRRSLRERLRDGIQSTAGGIPLPSFQTKSHSMDSKSIPTATTATTVTTTMTGRVPTTGGGGGIELMTTTGVTAGDQYITVSDKDTLTSLAAKYNSTPNELVRLNRLNSRFIFPGQKLKLPDKSGQSGAANAAAAAAHHHQQQLRLQRSNSSSVFGDESESGGEVDIEIRQKKFIKLKVKHITDGNGVVSGTLLITPNAIMFDPNVSDPLVLDQGAEIYGIILPIELIVAAGIFNDISNMRVKQSFIEPMSSTNVILYKPEFTTTTMTAGTVTTATGPSASTIASKPGQFTSHSMTSSQLQLSLSPLPLGKDEKTNILKRFSFPLTSTFSTSDMFGGGRKETVTHVTNAGRDGQETTCSAPPSTTSVTPVLGDHAPPTTTTTSLSLDGEPEEQKTDTTGDNTTTATTSTMTTSTETENLKFNEIEQWYLCLTTGYSITNNNPGGGGSAPSSRTAISPVSYGQKKYLKPEYWFSITSEDVNELYCFWNIWWPHLYGLVDMDVIKSRGYALIDWSTDLTTVLNLHRPIDRRMTTSGSGAADFDFESKVAAQAQQINELTKESWEMIKAPYGKLYSFLQRGQTILTSTTSCDSNYGSTSSGAGSAGGLPHLNNEQEFEIVSMSELDGRSTDYADTLPELYGGPSLIFKTDKHILNICKHLTARAEGYPWWLVFSTETNGFSLGTLYRKMEPVDEWSPILLVIEDTHERIFGALISAPLKLSEHFYGTGQSFLFNFTEGQIPGTTGGGGEENDEEEALEQLQVPSSNIPHPEHIEPTANVWKWTGENLFFIKGNQESVSIGAGDGKFGIWLDSDLFVGRTDSCWTYGNPPLVPERDFIVKTLEAWAFGVSATMPMPLTTPSIGPTITNTATTINTNTTSHNTSP